MKCVVNWIPLRIRVRSWNTQPHLSGKIVKQTFNEKIVIRAVIDSQILSYLRFAQCVKRDPQKRKETYTYENRCTHMKEDLYYRDQSCSLLSKFVQCVALCGSVLQCVALCCSDQSCSLLTEFVQCVAVCCSVLQCVAVCSSVLQCVAVCCSVLQCVAVYCSVLQWSEL